MPTQPSHDPLPRSFYDRPTLDVARDLIGCVLVRVLDSGERLTGIIVEDEAYLQGDPACHAYRGPTDRNRVMYGEPGHAYVYFSYGMHMMLNIVTQPAGIAEAVLIRAIEPEGGIDTMRRLRGDVANRFDLTSGPGKLAQAFDIDRRRHNGADLTSTSSPLYILAPTRSYTVDTSPRIGIRVGVDSPWRFIVHGNRYVSKTRPGLRSARAGATKT